MGNEKSLAHTRWNCKYHIVFAPKYRRQVFYREKRRAIGSILSGFAPIFPDTCYHLTHYWPAAADIPV
ncbi:transposase, partial [Escherichia coli]